MNISNIFIELIKLNQFNNECLCSFINVNKSLQKCIFEYLQNKLKCDHSKYINNKVSIQSSNNQCIKGIELNTFCKYYINMFNVKYNMFNLKTIKNYVFQSAGYNFCSDCGDFGLCTRKDTDSYSFDRNKRICKYGCLIKCCGIEHIIPKNIFVSFEMVCDADYMSYFYKMKCGCFAISRQYQNECDCGQPIISATQKCNGCNKIPLRWIEKSSESNEIKLEIVKLIILITFILFIIYYF